MSARPAGECRQTTPAGEHNVGRFCRDGFCQGARCPALAEFADVLARRLADEGFEHAAEVGLVGEA